MDMDGIGVWAALGQLNTELDNEMVGWLCAEFDPEKFVPILGGSPT